MIAQVYEIDVSELRETLTQDSKSLLSLWEAILPSTLLMLHNRSVLSLPKVLLEKPWKDAWNLLNEFT